MRTTNTGEPRKNETTGSNVDLAALATAKGEVERLNVFDFSNFSDEGLRDLHKLAADATNAINRQIGELVKMRDGQSAWGRAAWDELERRR